MQYLITFYKILKKILNIGLVWFGLLTDKGLIYGCANYHATTVHIYIRKPMQIQLKEK